MPAVKLNDEYKNEALGAFSDKIEQSTAHSHISERDLAELKQVYADAVAGRLQTCSWDEVWQSADKIIAKHEK